MKKIIKNIYETLSKLFYNMKVDHVSEASAQCAYYIILSFVPFVILLLTMIQYTGISQEALFYAISRVIPTNMEEMVLGIVQEVYSKSIGTISVSIIFTLWSAGKGLYALTKGLQTIYGVKGKKETNYFYLRFKALIQTGLFIILIAILLVGLVFGGSIVSLIKEQFKGFEILYRILTELGTMIFAFFVFLLLYKFMVRRHASLKSQVVGAAFGAVALKVVSFVFSIYLDIFRGFSITYGSLTTLMLIMMWTYACFYTVFLGAELNKLKDINNKTGDLE